MNLDSKQRRELKARAHHLKPVVRIGQKGLVPSIVAETDRCLQTHELIKVHIHLGDRAARQAVATELAHATAAALVHSIGKMCILYRKRREEA